MQTCDYCGRESDNSVAYCNECGTPFAGDDSQTALVSGGLTRDVVISAPLVRRPDVPVKRVIFLIGGVCWILFALGFGLFLAEYVVEGAGLQFFSLAVSSGSVLMGLAHVVGIFMAAVLCFAVGIGLCAHGFAPSPEHEKTKQKDQSSHERAV